MSSDWKVWVFIGSTLLFALTFVPAEFIALFNRKSGDTASERVWALPRPARYAIGGVSLVLGVWLGGHFAFGWWTT